MCCRLLSPVRIRSIAHIDPAAFIAKIFPVIGPLSVLQISICHLVIHKFTDTIVNTRKCICVIRRTVYCIQPENIILCQTDAARSPGALIDRDPERQQSIYRICILIFHKTVSCPCQLRIILIHTGICHCCDQDAVKLIPAVARGKIHIQELKIIAERAVRIHS